MTDPARIEQVAQAAYEAAAGNAWETADAAIQNAFRTWTRDILQAAETVDRRRP